MILHGVSLILFKRKKAALSSYKIVLELMDTLNLYNDPSDYQALLLFLLT